MIPLLVFYVHIVAFSAMFTKRFQEEGIGEGMLGVVFMALIFFVGWGMSSFVMRLVLPQEGFGTWCDRDAVSLLALAILEGVFYYFYYRGESAEQEADRTTSSGT